jgi:hypothetical protein
MGCGGSKVDDLPLVTLCRERKEEIKAASDHRYALAAAHVAYFHSLREVGDAIRRFVDEGLVIASSSTSPASPVLTLPPREGKSRHKSKDSSASTSLSHSADSKSKDDEVEDSHLHLSSGSDTESDSSGHIRFHDTPEEEEEAVREVPPTIIILLIINNLKEIGAFLIIQEITRTITSTRIHTRMRIRILIRFI